MFIILLFRLDCHEYAEFLKSKGDLAKAVRLLRLNCDEYKHAVSCIQYGNEAFTGNPKEKVLPDFKEAMTYFERSCELGSAAGCFNAGALLTSPRLNNIGIERDYARVSFAGFFLFAPNIKIIVIALDFSQGMEFLQESCEMGNGNSCLYVAGMYLVGVDNKSPLIGLPEKQAENVKVKEFTLAKDMEKAFAFTQKGCDLDNWRACSNLYQWHETGFEGVEKNLDISKQYKEKAEKLLQAEQDYKTYKAFH